MQVIAGCMPMELKIIQKIIQKLVTKIRRREHVVWNTYQFNPNDDLPEEYLKKEKKKLKAELYNQWQRN